MKLSFQNLLCLSDSPFLTLIDEIASLVYDKNNLCSASQDSERIVSKIWGGGRKGTKGLINPNVCLMGRSVTHPSFIVVVYFP